MIKGAIVNVEETTMVGTRKCQETITVDGTITAEMATLECDTMIVDGMITTEMAMAGKTTAKMTEEGILTVDVMITPEMTTIQEDTMIVEQTTMTEALTTATSSHLVRD